MYFSILSHRQYHSLIYSSIKRASVLFDYFWASMSLIFCQMLPRLFSIAYFLVFLSFKAMKALQHFQNKYVSSIWVGKAFGKSQYLREFVKCVLNFSSFLPPPPLGEQWFFPSFHHLSPSVAPWGLRPDITEVVSLNDSLFTASISPGGAVFSLQSKQPNQNKISAIFLAYKQHAFLGSLPDTSPGCLGFCKHPYWLQEGWDAIV